MINFRVNLTYPPESVRSGKATILKLCISSWVTKRKSLKPFKNPLILLKAAVFYFIVSRHPPPCHPPKIEYKYKFAQNINQLKNDQNTFNYHHTTAPPQHKHTGRNSYHQFSPVLSFQIKGKQNGRLSSETYIVVRVFSMMAGKSLVFCQLGGRCEYTSQV